MQSQHLLPFQTDLSSRFALLVKQKQQYLSRPVSERPFSKSAFVSSSEQTGKTLQVVA